MREQGRDVVEQDAGLRKVRHAADMVFQVHRQPPLEVRSVAGAVCAGYIVACYDDLATRPGRLSDLEIALGAFGLALLLAATWRLAGRALALAGAVALMLAVATGGSLADVVAAQWFSTRGV